MSHLLQAKNIGKDFRRSDGKSFSVIENINLDLQAGEIVGLLGASGSGKTTFLRIISGEETPDRGEVNSSIRRPSAQFGYLSQNDALLPWRSALANVALGLELIGQQASITQRTAREVLRSVGMEGFADNIPAQLSGGMQQRVLLARTLALKPKLLLLDEPMSSLDVPARRELAILLKNYAREQQAAILVVTHSIEEACFVADRILLMTRSPARLFKEIKISDNTGGLSRDAAFSTVMHDFCVALGIAA